MNANTVGPVSIFTVRWTVGPGRPGNYGRLASTNADRDGRDLSVRGFEEIGRYLPVDDMDRFFRRERRKGKENEYPDKFRRVQQTLKEVVDYLDEAEKLDPADKEQIEALKKELITLDEYAINISNASSGHRSKYDKIIENLNALLKKAEDGAQ